MKFLLLLTVCALPAADAAGQTVEFFPNEVRGLENTFTLEGVAGQSTIAKSLWLVNRTGQPLRVFARPHVEYGALYFTDGEKTSHEFSLLLAPGARGVLQLFGYDESSAARTCAGYLALAATPMQADGDKDATRTVKLLVRVAFKASKNQPDARPAPAPAAPPARPDRYEVVMRDGLPMRRHLRQLPLKIYSDHAQTGDTAAQYALIVRRAVEVWNQAGREIGMDRDFFQVVERANQADIRVDWTGTHLLSGAQGTAFPSDDLIGMLPLGRYRGLGRAAETLLQELCHMLGVAHSEVNTDIMYKGAHYHNLDLTRLDVTARDKQMLGWLYSQKHYIPLRE